MTHKSKICETALATHVEDCFETRSFTPLIVEVPLIGRPIGVEAPNGIKAYLEDEVQTELAQALEEGRDNLPSVEDVSKMLLNPVSATGAKKALNCHPTLTAKLQDNLNAAVASTLGDYQDEVEREAEATIREKLNFAPGAMDKMIESRATAILDGINFEEAIDLPFPVLPAFRRQELCELGLYFTEMECLRSEGSTYKPCGEEFTLLPGESRTESRKSTLVQSEDVTTDETVDDTVVTTVSDEIINNLVTEYSQELKKTTDIKTSISATVKGKIFKVLGLDMTAKASYDFNKFIKTFNKSVATDTRTRLNKVVRTLKVTSSLNQVRKVSLTDVTDFERKYANDTDAPITYIGREAHCVYSVIKKRTNVQLAWSGCIDEPGASLCTPDNIETVHAEKFNAIRQKWSVASPPSEFGSEPQAQTLSTNTFKKNNAILGRPYDVQISANIPGGYRYVANSATVHTTANVAIQGYSVTSQPGGGATGAVTFRANINPASTRKELLSHFTYQIISDAAAEWHERVAIWREEQAQAEIDALIAKEIEALEAWSLSDRVGVDLERQIMAKFFGIDEIDDCCKFLRKLRSIIDFDNLAYQLLPMWNDLGDGCQKSEPVYYLTAKCALFYVPFKEGREFEALAILAGIGAIPWTQNIRSQIFGYVNQINDARATLYNRAFDPTGLEPKVDGPHGYNLTSYDTSNTDEYESPCETDLNFELIDKFIVTVPSGGLRYDPRPALC